MKTVFTGSQTSRKSLFKRFLKIYIPSIGLVFLISWGIYYFQYIKTQEDIWRAREITIVSMQKELVQNTLRSIISDLKIIAYDQDVHDLIKIKSQRDVFRLPAEFISFSKYKGIYDQVRILDKTGMEILRIDLKGNEPFVVPEDKLQFKGKRYYFKDAYKLNKGEIFMSPLDLNIEKGEIETPIKPMIRFCTPLFNEAREKFGVLILNYFGEKLIEDLDKLSRNTPGHIMLINADGYFLKSMQPEDEWGFMFDERKTLTLENRYPAVWEKIITKDSGQTQNENGIFTFTKIYPLKEGVKSSSGSPRPFEASVRNLAPDEYYWTILSHVLPHQIDRMGGKFISTLVLTDLLLLTFLGFVFWKLVLANASRINAENELKNKNIELEEKIELRTKELRKRTYDLGERLKELNCLYRISKLTEREVLLEKIIEEAIEFIPLSWQYPEISYARIIFENQEFATDNFKKTAWQQTSDITVHGEMIGTVEVGYLEEMPEEDEGPFLKEERDLLAAIAARLGETFEHRQIEDEKGKLESRLQQAQKMEAIGTLAGGIAHDFNNILSIILGYADMAKEDAPPGTRFENDLTQVVTAANRAKDLVQQILAFSRQAEIERIPIKIQPLIKEGLKMLRSSIPSTISITEDIDPQSGVILADPTQIHQILMNLCTNAYHTMEEKGGVLSVTLKTTFVEPNDKEMLLHVNPGEYVEFTVADTGAGMGTNTLDKIFDPYFTTKEVGKGTGMGLAIIHGIMKEYGGAITVESMLGKGSTFHVYFPVVDKDVLPERKVSEDIIGGKERILFIDDEEILAEMGKNMLERLGYRVTVRRSSLEALSTFQNSPDEFDLVITDQTMPDMTGADLSSCMIQIRYDIPIILCTGYSSTIDKESAKILGIKEFVLKPLTKEVIGKLIRRVLGDKQEI